MQLKSTLPRLYARRLQGDALLNPLRRALCRRLNNLPEAVIVTDADGNPTARTVNRPIIAKLAGVSYSIMGHAYTGRHVAEITLKRILDALEKLNLIDDDLRVAIPTDARAESTTGPVADAAE